MVFDEYALGLNIGVIYYEQMGIPSDGNWWLSERFWSDRLWSSNVTSILWGPKGQFLYVATSRIYGDGSVFRLNLKEKSAKKIFPVDDINATDILTTEISGYNTKSNKIKIRVIFENKKTEENFEIPLN
jgi:hypothetical protein